MFAAISARELEKRAFRSTFQDGIWDLYLGALLFLMGFTLGLAKVTGLGEAWLMAITLVATVVLLLLFMAGKKYITIPRLGEVKFGAERQKKVKKVRLALSFSALVGLATFLGFGSLTNLFTELPGWVGPLGLFGVSSITVFSLGAYYLDYTRAYLYGWCFALAFPFGVLLQDSTPFGFLISYTALSLVMIVPGVVLLLRFIRDYPVPSEGMTQVGAGGSRDREED